MKKRLMALATLGLLLGSCGTTDKTGTKTSDAPRLESIVGTGTASLSVDLVRSNRGNAVAGSQVNLYRSGQRDIIVGQTTTDVNGYASFEKIPPGVYDLAFIKAHSAGSAVFGAIATETANTRLKAVQFESADPQGETQLPTLKLEVPATFKDTGEVDTYQPLTSGMTFTDVIYVRATALNAQVSQPMRYFLVSLGNFDETGHWSDLRTADGVATQDPGTVPAPDGTGADSGLLSLNAGGLSGKVYLQVVGIDFNYNRVAYLVPVNLNRSQAAGTVTAPTNVQAIAYTLRERVDYLAHVTPNAPTSGTNLWVTASWSAPASLSGYTGFRVLRAEQAAGPYIQVAFAGEKQCAAPPKNSTTRRCTVVDNTATLKNDQDYFYRIVAVGINEAVSPEPANPTTHTLPAFEPQLLSPGREERNVALMPVYTLKPNLPESATGFYMDLWVTDWLTGYDNAYSSGRLNFRRGLAPDGKTPEFQGILNVSGTNKFVYRSSNPTSANYIQYDEAQYSVLEF